MTVAPELLDAAVVFVVSLLVGTLSILVGVRLVVDSDAGVGNAAVTALLGAAAWALASALVGWIPFLGVVIMLLVWVGVINWRYPGGWTSAAAVGFVAWLVAVAIVFALASFDLLAMDVLGIPGT